MSGTAVMSLGWLAAAHYKFSLKRVYFNGGCKFTALRAPEREKQRKLFLKGRSLSLSLFSSPSLPFFSASIRRERLEFCHPFCGLLLPVVSLYGKCMKILLKEMKTLQNTSA